MSLDDKVSLVTGAGRGLGRGIALALAEAGSDVAVADIDVQLAEETAGLIRKAGRRSTVIRVDVTQPDDVAKMVAETESALGPVFVAVNNAGVVSVRPIEVLTVEEWDRLIAVNLRGVFLCTKSEVAAMRQHGTGRIINIASIAGRMGVPGLSHYCSSKFAVIGFTNAIAKEVAGEGITVNAICPGLIKTAMWQGDEGLSEKFKQPGESEEQSWARNLQGFVPQGVAQTPADMGQLAVYLAHAEHVTGQAIAVDGGASL